MRVLHVQKVGGIGGSERHLLTLLPALAERGIEIRMCVLAAAQSELFVAEARRAGIDTVVIKAGPDLNPVLVARLAADVRRFKPDLVHTHLVHADIQGQAVARMAGIPGVSSVHGFSNSFSRQPFRTAWSGAERMARLTIAISEHVATRLREHGLARPERIRMVHYGIDATGWQLPDAERQAARVELGIEPGQVAVGVASRLIPHKGHAAVIDAMGPARAEAPHLTLVVAGSGPLDDDLRRRAARQPPGAARLVGFVDDIRRFMNACDIVVFPTEPEFGEGFGLAALEAMAAGRALVTTDVGPLPELVVDGVTGLVVPPAAPAALAQALVALAGDPAARDRLGQAAVGRASSMFGLDRMVDRTLDVYHEAVTAPPGEA